MTVIQLAMLALFIGAIIAQAMKAAWRVEIILGAAAIALAASAANDADVAAILTRVPWDVLVMLGSLGVLSRLLADSRLFVRLAVEVTRLTRAGPASLVVVGSLAMFFVSGLVNNLTALLLVLPVVIAVLELVGTSQRHLRWTIGILLVACNLGGASTPIGDFPAILLLGAGAMGFVDYLVHAFPIALVALALLLAIVHFAVRPAHDLQDDPLRRALTVAAVTALHQRIRLDANLAVPSLLALAGMLFAWVAFPADVVPPHLIAWLGAMAALAATGHRARKALIRGFDVEATLFLFGLFVLVGAVRETGFFADLGAVLAALPVSPHLRVYLLVAFTGVATGLFSAGPTMAAMLEIAPPLAEQVSPTSVYVGLAFGVCAGSSLFLTAATSGPLAQSLVGRASLTDEAGDPVDFNFRSFIPVGALSFAVILATGLAGILLIDALGG